MSSVTKTIGDTTYTARTLTVKELREVLKCVEARKATDRLDLVEYLVEGGLPKEAFYLSLGLLGEADLYDIDDPQDVVDLMEMVAEANPTFAKADQRNLENAGKRLEEQVSLLRSLRTSAQTSS
jgi:hypothetical protein